MLRKLTAVTLLSFVSVAGCSSSDEGATPAAQSPEQQATLGVKQYVQTNLDALVVAAEEIAAAAPAPDADGWSREKDEAAVDKMRASWRKARVAYERIEGAIAVLFPELDVSTDERYDGFLADTDDTNLFDDQGVTGVHAIERVLWSDSAPARVLEFEKTLLGDKYRAPAFPANEAEARDFKEKLCARLVADTKKMQADFAPLALDLSTAYSGVIGSMAEQVEKADKATGRSDSAEESRYANVTLADMRANIEGGRQIYAAFTPWVTSLGAAAQADHDAVLAGFSRLDAAYAKLPGDALPAVPATWTTPPSAADAATPFGALFVTLSDEADEKRDASLVAAMIRVGGTLKLSVNP
ncbi:MAG: EfeM/EfeO family lipoprotein [Polyangiaceae bacterium]|nr:EfeM/EfeO family lipoprotein [Polyangiaceae bacterium]